MSVRPAQLPLPGGRDGATVVLYPLLCGDVAMPEAYLHRQPGLRGALAATGLGFPASERLRAPIVAFLLQHPAGPVLVDTGFHRDVMTAKARALGPVNALVFRDVRTAPARTVAAQLAARGIAPQDVRLIVMTHLHVDHASALSDFPGATVLVSGAEWQAARAWDAPLSGYHRQQLDPRLDYRLVRFPAPPASRAARLDQALDVFGDGAVRLLSTPGHSPGHLSAIVRLRDREALLAGDAIYTLATLRDGERPFRIPDPEAFEASIEVIARYERDHPDALVIPGHDMAAWSNLEDHYA